MSALAVSAMMSSERGQDTHENDDYALLRADLGIYVVADGVSGQPGGATASSEAVSAFVRRIERYLPSRRRKDEVLLGAVRAANNRLRHLARNNPMLSNMGTTLSAILVRDRHAALVHIGDSRVYLLRGHRLKRLTKDHTLISELIARKCISPHAAQKHPLRHVLSRSLGTHKTIAPDIQALAVEPGDWILLATDGLTQSFSDGDIKSAMLQSKAADCRSMCEFLMTQAISRRPADNVTIIVLKVDVSKVTIG